MKSDIARLDPLIFLLEVKRFDPKNSFLKPKGMPRKKVNK